MCTVLLPPGVNPIAVNKYIISYHMTSYHNINLTEYNASVGAWGGVVVKALRY
jgi:hypothetical protein